VWIFERGDGNRHLELASTKLMRLSIDSDQDVCSFWGNDDVVVQYQILRDAEASMRGSACLTPWNSPARSTPATEWFAKGLRVAAEVSSQGEGWCKE
jgi:hypothetical protein